MLTEEGCLLSQKYQIEECNLDPDHLESTILKITSKISFVIYNLLLLSIVCLLFVEITDCRGQGTK